MTWKKDSIALGSQGQSHGWWTLYGVCVHDMVPPLGDSRAGQARTQVPIVIFVLLAALAVQHMTNATFSEYLPVLLPLTSLILSSPQIVYSMIRAICITIWFCGPALWHGALSVQKGASPAFSADSSAPVWITACLAWGFLNIIFLILSLAASATRMLVWLVRQSVNLVE